MGGSNPDTIATLVLAQARVVLHQARLHCQLSSERLVHCHRLSPASQAGACHGAIGQWGGMGGRGGMWGPSSWLGAPSCWLGGLGRMGASNRYGIATLVLAQARVHFRLAPASKAERGRGGRGHPRREYGWLSASSCMLRPGSGRLRRLLVVGFFCVGRGYFFVSGRGASP